MLFKESSIGRHLYHVIDEDFLVAQEQPLAEKDIATALVPHFHKAWELKFFYPFGETHQHTIFFIPPGVIHASTLTESKLSLEINYQQINFGGFAHLWPNQILDDEDMEINIIPELLLSLSKIQNVSRLSKISYSLMSSALNNLVFLLESTSRKQSVIGKSSPLGSALNYMESRYFEENMSVVDIAHYAGVSPQYLNKIFREKTGKTTRQTLTAIRLKQAKELLEGGSYLVKDVARLTGWSCSFYFCNCFKRHYGVTPGSVGRVEG